MNSTQLQELFDRTDLVDFNCWYTNTEGYHIKIGLNGVVYNWLTSTSLDKLLKAFESLHMMRSVNKIRGFHDDK